MNQTEEAKRIALIAIGATFFLGAAVILFWFRPDNQKPQELALPVPLGTNILTVGARLYNPHPPNQLLWEVIAIEPEHEFPDGEVREGVKVRGTNSAISSWMPRENMSKLMVVQ